jgi:predicted alpha/beta-hydrolase family hydrolase
VAAERIEIDTPRGPARAHLHPAGDPPGAVVLGHGAGGSVDAPDLTAATEAAVELGLTVALVEQPYRVAGRRSSPPAAHLDQAWTAAIASLREGPLAGLPLVAGGRSAGARVACRTAAATGADAVLCLAFPLHPPGKPEKSRQDELDAVRVPILVVQGESDQFGTPKPGANVTLVEVPGNHGLKEDLDAVAEAVRGWLPTAIGGAAGRS